MSTVGLADGSIERLVMNVIDAPAVVTTAVRRRKPAADELREKLACLLAVDDAGKRGVLPEKTDAGVLHHKHEKARLALGESESSDRGDTVLRLHQNTSSARCGSNGRPRLPVRAVTPRYRENPDRLTAAA